LKGRYAFRNVDFIHFPIEKNIMLNKDVTKFRDNEKEYGLIYAGIRDRSKTLNNFFPKRKQELPNLIVGMSKIENMDSECKFEYHPRVVNADVPEIMSKCLASLYITEDIYIKSIQPTLRLYESIQVGTVPLFDKKTENILRHSLDLDEDTYNLLLVENSDDVKERLAYLDLLTKKEYDSLIQTLYNGIKFDEKEYKETFCDIVEDILVKEANEILPRST
jgi:hypothetical protein